MKFLVLLSLFVISNAYSNQLELFDECNDLVDEVYRWKQSGDNIETEIKSLTSEAYTLNDKIANQLTTITQITDQYKEQSDPSSRESLQLTYDEEQEQLQYLYSLRIYYAERWNIVTKKLEQIQTIGKQKVNHINYKCDIDWSRATVTARCPNDDIKMCSMFN